MTPIASKIMLKKVKENFAKIKPILLTKEEAATLLKVSPNTFWERFVVTQKIRVVYLDAEQKHPLFSYPDLETFVAQSTITWTPELDKIIKKAV